MTEAGRTWPTADQVISRFPKIIPVRAKSSSPTAAPSAATPIGAQADSLRWLPTRPAAYPTRQNTSAYWPTRWVAGGATSRARPAQKPPSMPSSGPPVSPRATTTTRTRSGPAPPGRRTLLRTVSWIRIASSSRPAANAARRTSGPRSGSAGRRRHGGPGLASTGRRGDRDGDPRSRSRRRRQHGEARVGARRDHHHADHAQRGVVGERPGARLLGQRAAGALELGDPPPGAPGHVGAAARRAEGDQLLAGMQ